jgi:hypothetical protein
MLDLHGELPGIAAVRGRRAKIIADAEQHTAVTIFGIMLHMCLKSASSSSVNISPALPMPESLACIINAG